MPSNRRCVLVRLSDDALNNLDAVSEFFGVSRSAIIAAIVEARPQLVSEVAVSLNQTGFRRSAAFHNVKCLDGSQVAVSSTTATNSHRREFSDEKPAFAPKQCRGF